MSKYEASFQNLLGTVNKTLKICFQLSKNKSNMSKCAQFLKILNDYNCRVIANNIVLIKNVFKSVKKQSQSNLNKFRMNEDGMIKTVKNKSPKFFRHLTIFIVKKS